MTAREAYQIWAPAGKKWVDWVRPVPFVMLKDCTKGYRIATMTATADCADELYKDAAIIVDLPGAESVRKGIALARCGYRPIPVFNGTIEQCGARATTDNQSVGTALLQAAEELEKTGIAENALPAFLLDRNRLQRYKAEAGIYDNSWDIYPQDLPSAEYFLKNGIRRMIVIGDSIAGDLKRILYGFQKKQIEICLTDGYEVPKKTVVPVAGILIADRFGFR